MSYNFKERILKNVLVDLTKQYDSLLLELQSLKKEAKNNYGKDYLTNLLNREGFLLELKKIYEMFKIHSKQFGIIAIDLDDFKFINLHYGAEIGEIYIVSFSEYLYQQLLKLNYNFLLARFWGNCFVICLEEIHTEDLIKITNQIKREIDNYNFQLGDTALNLTSSIGISISDLNKSPEKVLEEALNALSEAKKKGRNLIQFYDISFQKKLNKIIEGRNLVLDALRKDKFNKVLLYIHPIVDRDTKLIIGGEVLLRLQVDGKVISPIKFLESAIYFGLIYELEEKIIEILKSINFPPNIKIFLNKIMLDQEEEHDFKKKLEILSLIQKEKNISFIIEIVENSIIKNIELIKKNIKFARNLNIEFAIDDFGDGYTSLKYLYELEVSYLKISGNLIRQMRNSKKSISIVKGIVDISKSLNLKTIAEFVESEEEFNLCKDLGINYIQGYYFYEPIEINEFFNSNLLIKN